MVCLACLGDGVIDLRDQNALIGELATDEELAMFRQTDGWLRPVRRCDECEGTGVMSQERHDELMAISRTAVAQLMAGLENA